MSLVFNGSVVVNEVLKQQIYDGVM